MQNRPDFTAIKRKILLFAVITLIVSFSLTFLLAFLAFTRENLFAALLPLAVGAFGLGLLFFFAAIRQYRLTQKAERTYKGE
jgi:polyferredoxin